MLPIRLTASNTTYTATPNMRSTDSSEANTSARYEPYVRRPAGSVRVATRVATRAAPNATTSAAMCPASDSSASEPDSRP